MTGTSLGLADFTPSGISAWAPWRPCKLLDPVCRDVGACQLFSFSWLPRPLLPPNCLCPSMILEMKIGRSKWNKEVKFKDATKVKNVPLVSLILLKRSLVFPSLLFSSYFFAVVTDEGFLISPCYSLELCIQTGISFLFSFAFGFSSHRKTMTRCKLKKKKIPHSNAWAVSKVQGEAFREGSRGRGCWGTELSHIYRQPHPFSFARRLPRPRQETALLPGSSLWCLSQTTQTLEKSSFLFSEVCLCLVPRGHSHCFPMNGAPWVVWGLSLVFTVTLFLMVLFWEIFRGLWHLLLKCFQPCWGSKPICSGVFMF